MIKEKKLLTGGTLKLTPENMVFKFDKQKTIISTSSFCGGISKVEGVFNQKLPLNIYTEKDLPGESLGKYLDIRSKALNFDKSSGLITSARMECFAYSNLILDGVIVETFVTAGANKNAARAGDKPLYKEVNGGFVPLGGTINLFIFLSNALSDGLLTRALITATEAKSALLGEFGVYSSYGTTTATGTGTDGIIIAIDDDSSYYNDVGTHSQLGYMIAQTVKEALARALTNETYYTRQHQKSLVNFMSRESSDQDEYILYLNKFNKLSFQDNENLIRAFELIAPLKERYSWGGISEKNYFWIMEMIEKQYPILKEWIEDCQKRKDEKIHLK